MGIIYESVFREMILVGLEALINGTHFSTVNCLGRRYAEVIYNHGIGKGSK